MDAPYPRLTPFQEIDNFHDNWWREDVGSSHGGWVTIDPNVLSIGFPAVLNSAQKLRAAAEQAELRALGGASHYLPRVVLDWGKKHVADPRVPEALHLAVRAMRYGSSNEWSHEAFTLLHKNYPNSEWANQTPYWFK